MGIFNKLKEMLSGFDETVKAREEAMLPPVDVSLEYKDVKGWLDSVSGPVFSDVDDHVASILKTMGEIKVRLLKDALELKNAKIDEMRDKRMERAVINNRRALYSKLNTFIHGVDVTRVSASSAFGFFDSVNGQMAHFMTDTKKNFYFVDSGMSSVSKDIKDDLFEFGKKIDEAVGYIKPLKDKILSIDESYKLLRELDVLSKKKKEHESILKSGKKSLKGLVRSSIDLKKEVDDFDKGKDARDLEGLNMGHKEVLDEIGVVKGRIVQYISLVSRALKKYSRVAQLANKDEEKLLMLYVDDPATAVEMDDGLRLLRGVASDLEMHVGRGSISIKDKLKAKTLAAVLRLRNDNDLDELKVELLVLKDKERTLLAKIKSNKTAGKKKDLDDRYLKLSQEVKMLKSDVAVDEKMVESMDSDIASNMARLEGKLNDIGNYAVRISY